MGIPKTPTYGRDWKAKRQTRIKPSGMTKLLEGCDKAWNNYDRETFIRSTMGNNAVSDISRFVIGLVDATHQISELAHRHDGDYDKKEKEFIRSVLADIDEEQKYWKEKKRKFVLEEGDVKLAVEKLTKLGKSFDEALDKVDIRAKQLEAIHSKLAAADKLGDHRAPALALEAFQKGVNELATLLDDADARSTKLTMAANQAQSGHASDAPLKEQVKGIHRHTEESRKTLNDRRADKVLWSTWVKKQLALA